MLRFATVCACLLALAACTGTTEARENRDLEPGSGDLGSGDVVEPPDPVGDPAAGEDLSGGAPDTSTPLPTGALCETAEGQREIRAVPSTLLLTTSSFDERLAVVQLGDTAEVAERLRTQRELAADAGVPGARAVNVTTIACADEAAAAIAFRVWEGDQGVHRTAGVMLVGGRWQLTLASFCRLMTLAPCAEVPGMDGKAAKLLSPSLRPRAGTG
jgi:hypothetical protein